MVNPDKVLKDLKLKWGNLALSKKEDYVRMICGYEWAG